MKRDFSRTNRISNLAAYNSARVLCLLISLGMILLCSACAHKYFPNSKPPDKKHSASSGSQTSRPRISLPSAWPSDGSSGISGSEKPHPSLSAIDEISFKDWQRKNQKLLLESDRYNSGLDLDDALTYFSEVALSSEFSEDKFIGKWTIPILIELAGDANDADKATLRRHIDLLKRIPGLPDIELLDARSGKTANLTIYYVPYQKMASCFPQGNYQDGNQGMFYDFWHQGAIYKGIVAIDSSIPRQNLRNHLLLEELTQALGPRNDSYRYPESIYQQDAQYMPQELLPIDIAVLRFIYLPTVRPGMEKAAALQAVRTGIKAERVN